MKKWNVTQETLKIIACVTMLVDHLAVVLVLPLYYKVPGEALDILWLYYSLRGIGRFAFPIYCFLLVEGVFHTRNPRKYGLRLAIGMLLAEIPYDYLFRGGFTWEHQNVMLTLLLGFVMVEGMKRVQGIWKAVIILPFWHLANLLHGDYEGYGILLIALFALCRGIPEGKPLMVLGMAMATEFTAHTIGSVTIYPDMCVFLSLIPIFLYSGEKKSYSKTVQQVFYLFYPVHMVLLLILQTLLS